MNGYLKLKAGVTLDGIRPELLLAIQIIESCWRSHFPEIDCVITSITDGEHKKGSFHYIGHALDLRTKNIKTGKEKFLIAIEDSLGENYDCVFEGVGQPWEHLHIEYDPKE